MVLAWSLNDRWASTKDSYKFGCRWKTKNILDEWGENKHDLKMINGGVWNEEVAVKEEDR